MACNLAYGDGPMTVAQLFACVRHRFAGLSAYYLKERDVIAIPLSDAAAGEAAVFLRELAARKGLSCCTVTAAWPELAGPEIISLDGASEFLVISGTDR
ncbi:MAG: hypothetical protein A4E28_01549 [Methanocella sp. PtaU1.Bin125]|nr:MAG: hypothetical protein A4E28_01549 [Methanocella sp. PtaU1.Bin125]